jgi:hypothetical protein
LREILGETSGKAVLILVVGKKERRVTIGTMEGHDIFTSEEIESGSRKRKARIIFSIHLRGFKYLFLFKKLLYFKILNTTCTEIKAQIKSDISPPSTLL